MRSQPPTLPIGPICERSNDGIGVYRVSLLSFPVFFQWKRYSGSVGPGATALTRTFGASPCASVVVALCSALLLKV